MEWNLLHSDSYLMKVHVFGQGLEEGYAFNVEFD